MPRTITIKVHLPHWAAWIAQDPDGSWWVFSGKPIATAREWDMKNHHGKMARLTAGFKRNTSWRETLKYLPAGKKVAS